MDGLEKADAPAGGGDGTRGARPRRMTREAEAPPVAGAIGQALKAHYSDLVSAPLPDRFLELLSSLEAREKQGG